MPVALTGAWRLCLQQWYSIVRLLLQCCMIHTLKLRYIHAAEPASAPQASYSRAAPVPSERLYRCHLSLLKHTPTAHKGSFKKPPLSPPPRLFISHTSAPIATPLRMANGSGTCVLFSSLLISCSFLTGDTRGRPKICCRLGVAASAGTPAAEERGGVAAPVAAAAAAAAEGVAGLAGAIGVAGDSGCLATL